MGHFIKNLKVFHQAQLLRLFCLSLPVGMFLLPVGAGGRPQGFALSLGLN